MGIVDKIKSYVSGNTPMEKNEELFYENEAANFVNILGREWDKNGRSPMSIVKGGKETGLEETTHMPKEGLGVRKTILYREVDGESQVSQVIIQTWDAETKRYTYDSKGHKDNTTHYVAECNNINMFDTVEGQAYRSDKDTTNFDNSIKTFESMAEVVKELGGLRVGVQEESTTNM